MARRFLDTTSPDFGLGDLLLIVIFLQAQAADTPRDHCMVFRVCSGGLEPANALCWSVPIQPFLACVNVISHLLVAQESPLLAQR